MKKSKRLIESRAASSTCIKTTTLSGWESIAFTRQFLQSLRVSKSLHTFQRPSSCKSRRRFSSYLNCPTHASTLNWGTVLKIVRKHHRAMMTYRRWMEKKHNLWCSHLKTWSYWSTCISSFLPRRILKANWTLLRQLGPIKNSSKRHGIQTLVNSTQSLHRWMPLIAIWSTWKIALGKKANCQTNWIKQTTALTHLIR